MSTTHVKIASKNERTMRCHAIVKRRFVDTDDLGQKLEKIVQNQEQPLPSLQEIARRLDWSVQVLVKYFPDLCKEIVNRRKAYLMGKRDQKIRQMCHEVIDSN